MTSVVPPGFVKEEARVRAPLSPRWLSLACHFITQAHAVGCIIAPMRD
jgi:hypothetical protein